jgi:hypothetical protein
MKTIEIIRKRFNFQTVDYVATITVALEKGKEYGFIENLGNCPQTVYSLTKNILRTLWEETNEQTVLEDVELYTRREFSVSFATMQSAIAKLKIRDYFGIESDYSQEDRQHLFSLWYSPEARALTHRFQFPLLKTQLSTRFPNEKELVFEKPGHKKWVDKLLCV